jgi:predicted O-linked N-acetylglucosamine transferase (SPINDLY family)
VCKFHPSFDAALLGLLRRAPSVLLLMIGNAPNSESCHFGGADKATFLQRLQHRADFDASSDRGGNGEAVAVAERILFVPQLAHSGFLRLLQASDFMLDTFPFGSGVAALEAFAAQVRGTLTAP